MHDTPALGLTQLTSYRHATFYVPLQPLDYQQTLIKSFTLGGVGLHSGEYGKCIDDPFSSCSAFDGSKLITAALSEKSAKQIAAPC